MFSVTIKQEMAALNKYHSVTATALNKHHSVTATKKVKL